MSTKSDQRVRASHKLTLADKRSLKSMQKQDGHPLFDFHWIPFKNLNILPQVRKVFEAEALDILATDIGVNSLINQPNVIFYSREMTELYLKTINTLHNTELIIDDLVPATWRGKRGYFILVAGERRCRAMKILTQQGCLRCRNERAHLIKKDGAAQACYTYHFNRAEPAVQCKVMSGVSPFKALNLQMSENLHVRPSSHEEANMFTGYYKLLKLINPSYTVAKFCRRINRPTATIASYIGYCDLPSDIQKYVESGDIAFGIARQLVRLRNQLESISQITNKKEKEAYINKKIETFFIRAITQRKKVHEFKKMIDIFLAEERSGQGLLFAELKDARPKYAQAINPKIITSLAKETNYVALITKLLNDGFLIGKDGIMPKDSDESIMLSTLFNTTSGFVKNVSGKVNPEIMTQIERFLETAQKSGRVA